MPYQKVDQALIDYTTLLRDKVAAENLTQRADARDRRRRSRRRRRRNIPTCRT